MRIGNTINSGMIDHISYQPLYRPVVYAHIVYSKYVLITRGLIMSDEQPVALKKRKILPPVSRIIHYEWHNKLEDVTPLTAQSFDTIKRSASIRQSAATEAHRLESICAKIPTNFDSAIHGYHRWCYCSFTNVGKISKTYVWDFLGSE